MRLLLSPSNLSFPKDCMLRRVWVWEIPWAKEPGGLQSIRILEWVVISFYRVSSSSRDRTHVSCISYTGRQILTAKPSGKPPFKRLYSSTIVLSRVQLFETPWTVVDSGSSVHGILQARILECIAISSSRGSSRLRDGTCVSGVSCTAGRFFTTEPPE